MQPSRAEWLWKDRHHLIVLDEAVTSSSFTRKPPPITVRSKNFTMTPSSPTAATLAMNFRLHSWATIDDGQGRLAGHERSEHLVRRCHPTRLAFPRNCCRLQTASHSNSNKIYIHKATHIKKTLAMTETFKFSEII